MFSQAATPFKRCDAVRGVAGKKCAGRVRGPRGVWAVTGQRLRCKTSVLPACTLATPIPSYCVTRMVTRVVLSVLNRLRGSLQSCSCHHMKTIAVSYVQGSCTQNYTNIRITSRAAENICAVLSPFLFGKRDEKRHGGSHLFLHDVPVLCAPDGGASESHTMGGADVDGLWGLPDLQHGPRLCG